MQDTLFGPPTCLRGQLGLICLFHEPLTPHQVKTLHDGGKRNIFLSNYKMILFFFS